MTVLAEYLKSNKATAYSFATSNTKYNEQNRPVISKDDEWVNETEWNNLFQALEKNNDK